MGRVASVVTRDVRVVVTSRERVEPLAVVLRYDTSDPFAVCAEFVSQDDPRVRWYFARDLLATGLVESVGLGDVRVGPVERGGEALVAIALMPRDGHAVVEVARADVEAFLLATFAACPLGAESPRLDVDGAVRALLAT